MIVERPRQPHVITDIKMFQDVVAFFGQAINSENSSPFIARLLHHETQELIEAIEQGHALHHIVAEADDVIMFITEMFNILEYPLENAFVHLRPHDPPKSLDDLQLAVFAKFAALPKEHDLYSISRLIAEKSESIVQITSNGNKPAHIIPVTADIAIHAVQIFNLLDFSLAEKLSDKLNRNQHKYNIWEAKILAALPGMDRWKARQVLKNAWTPEMDEKFLKEEN